MEPWPNIPTDVVGWFRGVFLDANKRVCERLENLPNIRETSLDDGLVEALIPNCAPTLLSSGAIVRMDTHNIGGLRRLGPVPWELDYLTRRRWETADIAILVFIYRGNTLVGKKIGLLQSKRLFPANNDVEEDDEITFQYGMNAFLHRENKQAVATLHRNFHFNRDCLYGAIKSGADQCNQIDRINVEFGKTVYYLLYNPHSLPVRISYPLQQRIVVNDIDIGCRVYDSEVVHRVLSGLAKGKSPSFSMIENASNGKSWPLEVWAADLLLTCKVGEQFDDARDGRVRYFLERRSGPIGAALAVSITLPD